MQNFINYKNFSVTFIKNKNYLGTKLLHGALFFSLPTKMPFEKHSPFLLKMQLSVLQFMFMVLQWWYGATSGSCSNMSRDTSSTILLLSISKSLQSELLSTCKFLRLHFAFSLYMQLYFLHITSINHSPKNNLNFASNWKL